MIECNCEQCKSGAATPMDEWLDNPIHQQIHDELKDTVYSGVVIKGERNENPSGVVPSGVAF